MISRQEPTLCLQIHIPLRKQVIYMYAVVAAVAQKQAYTHYMTNISGTIYLFHFNEFERRDII